MARHKAAKEIKEFWSRLDLPIEALWRELNKRQEATDFMVEALILSLRRGTDALADKTTLHRVSQLSERQLLDVMTRLQKFKPHIAPAWTDDQLEVLAAVRRKL